jgi:uncharacterized membrane protein
MMPQILYIWERLKGSFLLIPLIIVFLGIVLATLFIYIDSVVIFNQEGIINFIFIGGAESARSVLSTIAVAMLSVAGIVFSITLVVLSMASSQFGPRLLRNFMYDKLNQIVLGTYLSTFIYCLIVLRSVKSYTDMEFIPNFSIVMSIILAIGNVILLILYIHHISVSIQADHIISEVNANLNNNIQKLFSDDLSEEHLEANEKYFNELKNTRSFSESVKNKNNGYLEVIDKDNLISIAQDNDLVLFIKYRPGDFLVEDMELVKIYSHQKIGDEVKEKIRKAFVLGKVRTPIQDPEFAINQMVEIAVRSLSAGINDPFTAITCIDNLTATLCYLTKIKFPSAYLFDDDGQLRIKVNPILFSGIINASFNQIRQFGKDSPSVIIRMMDALVTINQLARDKEQKDDIQRHAKMVLKTAEKTMIESNDLKDLKKRYEKLKVAYK